jgi:hypothetical protein
MSYKMRFIQTDDEPVTIDMLKRAICDDSPDCDISDSGEINGGGQSYGRVSILSTNQAGAFEEEIGALTQMAKAATGAGKRKVLKVLGEARAIVSVEVAWGEREPEETLQKIDPLWRWLFSNRQGLVQADDEGYYEQSRKVLSVE